MKECYTVSLLCLLNLFVNDRVSLFKSKRCIMKLKNKENGIGWNVNLKCYSVVTVCLLLFTNSSNAKFVHPGILHTQESFEYMENLVDNQIRPAYGSFLLLQADSKASSSYKMKGPFSEIGRSKSKNGNTSRDDFVAAYRNALMWKITGDTAHAEKAEEILVGYANTLETICGETDQILLVGMRGFIFVNAAEIMRDYLSSSDLKKVKRMFEELFVPICHDFYGWDPFTNGNIGASVCKATIGLAIFLDDEDLYDEGIDWYLNGTDNGVLKYYVDNRDGQLQESGRDQQHCHGGIGCLAEAAEAAHNQGDDLYSGYKNDNRLRKGFEYVAKYNLGHSVPFYTWDDVTGKYDNWTSISSDRRGEFRAIYEMAYNHYVTRKGMSMPWTEAVLDEIRPEVAGYGGRSSRFRLTFILSW